jgi:hypothetical protein
MTMPDGKDAMENDATQGAQGDAPHRHPADSQHWIGDTWVGEDWDAAYAGDNLLTDARHALTVVDDYVRSRPWETLAIVAVVGIALGYGLARASAPR